MTYLQDKSQGTDPVKNVANYVDKIMDFLASNEQRDALWLQIRSSPTLWSLLSSAVETGQNKPEFQIGMDADLDGFVGRSSHVGVSGEMVHLNPNTVTSDGGIGTVSTILAHETAHIMLPLARGYLADAYNAARLPNATLESVARLFVQGEKEAFYISNMVRLEVMGNTPGISAKNFPKPIEFSISQGVTTKVEAIAELETQLSSDSLKNADGKVYKSPYREQSDHLYLLAKAGFPLEFCRDVTKSGSVVTKIFSGGATLSWTGPSNREFIQYFRAEADGSLVPLALKCTNGNGLSFEAANLACQQDLLANLNIDRHNGLLKFTPESHSYSSSAWGSVVYNDYSWEGDVQVPVNTDFGYFVSAKDVSSVTFGAGTFSETLLVSAGASIKIDGSLDGSGVTITRQEGCVRIAGADGQYLDVFGWDAANVQRTDGVTFSLTSLLANGVEQVVLGSGMDDSLTISTPDGVLYAGAGNDTASSSDANCVVHGEAGNDVLSTSGTHAVLNGDDGADTLRDFGTSNILNGGADNDTLWLFGSSSTGDGGTGNDFLIAGGSNNTARGGLGADFISNIGMQNTIVGGEGNDTIADYAGSATISWARGDGADTVVQASGGTTLRFEKSTTPYSITAYVNDNSDLVLQTSLGGSVTVSGWGYGANQLQVETPEGAIWSSADIGSQFKPATYSVSYTNLPAVRIEDAFNMFMSYCRPTSNLTIPGEGRWDNDTRADNIDLFVSQTGGGVQVDEAGNWVTSCSNSFTYSGATTTTYPFSDEDGNFYGNYWVHGSVDMSWDRWTDDSGQTWIALTHVNNYIWAQSQWMEPPTLDNPNWTQHGNAFAYQSINTSSSRVVTVTEPAVDHVVLGTPPVHAAAMSMMANETLSFAATTAAVESSSLAMAPAAADMPEWLTKLFDADTLAIWDTQAQQALHGSGHTLPDVLLNADAPAVGLVGIAGLMQLSHVM